MGVGRFFSKIIPALLVTVDVFSGTAEAACAGTLYFKAPSSWSNAYVIFQRKPIEITQKDGDYYVFDLSTHSGQGWPSSTFGLASTNCNVLCTAVVSANQWNAAGDVKEDFACPGAGEKVYVTENPLQLGTTYAGSNPPDAKYFYVKVPQNADWLWSTPMVREVGAVTGKAMTAVPGRCGWFEVVWDQASVPTSAEIYDNQGHVIGSGSLPLSSLLSDATPKLYYDANAGSLDFTDPGTDGSCVSSQGARLFFLMPEEGSWLSSAPMLSSDGGVTGSVMTPVPGMCGWYQALWPRGVVPPENVVIYRGNDSKRENIVGVNGLWGEAAPIPLRQYFIEKGANLYFIPDDGVWDDSMANLGWTTADPHIDGVCSFNLAALIYDTDESLNPLFTSDGNNSGFGACTGVRHGIVKQDLGTNNKPVFNAGNVNATLCAEDEAKFNTLFNYTPGVNEVQCYDMPFRHYGTDTRWGFDSDSAASLFGGYNGFHPIENTTDATVVSSISPQACPTCRTKRYSQGPVPYTYMGDFDKYCNTYGWDGGVECEGLFGNGDNPSVWDWGAPRWEGYHNQHFCFESHASFVYYEDQEFTFRGDDDIWVFINKKLALDNGGAHMAAPGHVVLKKLNDVYGEDFLVPGKEYPLDIFFCDRRTTMSNVIIKANMFLKSKFVLEKKVGDDGLWNVDVCYEPIADNSCSARYGGVPGPSSRHICGESVEVPGRTMRYYIATSSGQKIADLVSGKTGLQYGGFDLSNKLNPKIYPESIAGLFPGDYQLVMEMCEGWDCDESARGTLPFTVAQGIGIEANHLLRESDAQVSGYSGSPLNIGIAGVAGSDITFDYCLEFDGSDELGGVRASIADVDTNRIRLPICGKNTASAKISKGKQVLDSPIKVYVKDDALKEKTESFTMKILNLSGGGFGEVPSELPVDIFISDNDTLFGPIPRNDPVEFSGVEDSTLVISEFNARYRDGTSIGSYDVIISSLPDKGQLKIFGIPVEPGQSISSMSLGNLVFTPEQNQNGSNYTSFKFRIKSGNQVSDISVASIGVAPVNDAPVAEGCIVQLPELSEPGTRVCAVSASDDDVLTKGAGEAYRLTYSIVSGNDDELFSIDGQTGVVRVVGLLDYESLENHDYSLEVEVSDGLESVVVSVDISVTDVNEGPVLSTPFCVIAENTKVFTEGCRITGVDPEGDSLTYVIAEGNVNATFEINELTGEITAKKTIDFEMQQEFTLFVDVSDGKATERGIVFIQVVDEDEPLTVIVRNGTVVENSAINTLVNCGTDDEGGERSCVNVFNNDYGTQLTYSIMGGNIDGAFGINNRGDVFVTNSSIDYETMPNYTLAIGVCESRVGGTEPECVYKSMIITVMDGNERPTAKNTECTIEENSAIGLATDCWIEADDPEDGYASLKYEITDGEGKELFSVDNDGNIFVAGQVDYESLPSDEKYYTLTITVEDLDGLSTVATAKINVADMTEGPLVTHDTCWIMENTMAFLDESGSPKTCQVIGVDPDGGQISFTLSSDMFSVDTNGVISVKSGNMLDYETAKDYSLVVDVSDGGTTVKAAALIHVLDANEVPAVIVRNGSIIEGAAAGEFVNCGMDAFGAVFPCVEASDEEDSYDKLTYTIVSGDPDTVFMVNGQGDIIVNRDGLIDFEKNVAYSLEIEVCDVTGTPQQCTTKTSVVSVIQTVHGFNTDVTEGDSVGKVIGTVRGGNGSDSTRTFAITGGNTGKLFEIDQKTGEVRIANDIDYERLTQDQNPITLRIRVTGADDFSADTVVVVGILNVNEPPSISNDSLSILENLPAGTEVGRLLPPVDDDQTSEYTQNRFEAIGGDMAQFKVDTLGVITSKRSFDYENDETAYTLVVRVYDQEGNADTATVVVTVEDQPEISRIEITRIVTISGSHTWDYPKGWIYTDEDALVVQWTMDGRAMPDTLIENLKEGSNMVTLAYGDPSLNLGTRKTIGIVLKRGVLGLAQVPENSWLNIAVAGREIRITGAAGRPYAVLDMQGRVIARGEGAISGTVVRLSRAGSYLVKVGSDIRKIRVK